MLIGGNQTAWRLVTSESTGTWMGWVDSDGFCWEPLEMQHLGTKGNILKFERLAH
jgi:hypothetical protein